MVIRYRWRCKCFEYMMRIATVLLIFEVRYNFFLFLYLRLVLKIQGKSAVGNVLKISKLSKFVTNINKPNNY